VGAGEAKEEKVPLSETIRLLNDRFGTQFTEGDRLSFLQIKKKARTNEQVIQTALANRLDNFGLDIRKLVRRFHDRASVRSFAKVFVR
jgi:type I restriction enzyme, R subunit